MYTDIFLSTFLQPVNGSKSSVEVFSTDIEKKSCLLSMYKLCTAQKMKFSIKDFFSKYDQIRFGHSY